MAISDEQARDSLILHLERSVKENRMILRDQFAMAGLTGVIADGCREINAAAKYAYQYADAMLLERVKQ